MLAITATTSTTTSATTVAAAAISCNLLSNYFIQSLVLEN